MNLPLQDARALALHGLSATGREMVGLAEIPGRVSAANIASTISQPPFRASAMDGYAVRFEDARIAGATLKLIGETPAGWRSCVERLGPGEAARVFTGSIVPDGGDHVLVQEEARRTGDHIEVATDQPERRNIRQRGIDFEAGDILAHAGQRMHAIHAAIIAAANIGEIEMFARPRLALLSSGDELREPGSVLEPGQIVNSNRYALAALARSWGGEPDYLGNAPDQVDAIADLYRKAASSMDALVVVGGASVGDRDLVKPALLEAGGSIVFENVAIRPGKPTWLGRLGGRPVLGLPGNPASAIVCAALFLRPMLSRLSGCTSDEPERGVSLVGNLPANGEREAFLRCRLVDGVRAAPVANQDSSLLSPFATADILLRRPPHAPPAADGDRVPVVPLCGWR